MTKNKRITTLIKDYNEVEKDVFQKNSISLELNDLTVNLKKELNFFQKWEKTISAFKNKNKEAIFNSDLKEIEEYSKNISFGFQKILKIEKVEFENDPIAKHLFTLLKTCTKLRNSKISLEEFVKNYIVIKIKYSVNDKETEGYSVLKQNIEKKYHNQNLTFKKSTMPRFLMLDLASFFGETLINNNLEKLALKNKEITTYLTSKEMFQKFYQSYGNILFVPTEEKFQKDLLNVLEKMSLLNKDIIQKPSSELNRYKNIFYLETNTKGNLIGANENDFKKIMLPEFLNTLENVKTETTEEQEGRKNAKAYQTKQHITKEKEEKMNTTSFLEIFNYVEIDNSVDLDKFEVIENEFKELRKIIHIPKLNEHSFRIKKLGRHKAAGLYYPFYKTLIVDVNNPDSFVHELGHLIDNLFEETSILSKQVDFRPIIDLYKDLVTIAIEELEEDNPLKNNWFSKNKYNKNYYFQNTEIFARSFELYLFNKKIESSLLQKEYRSAIYPTDKEFSNKIAIYFDELFKKIPLKN